MANPLSWLVAGEPKGYHTAAALAAFAARVYAHDHAPQASLFSVAPCRADPVSSRRLIFVFVPVGGSRSIVLVTLTALAGACGAFQPSRARGDAPAHSSGAPSTEDRPRMPGPAPQAREGRAADPARRNAECASCHADIAAEWQASLHREAHSDPAYQRALAIEPLPFCRGCHAPEADPTMPAPEALGAIGVGCVTCHETGGGHILAAPRADRSRAPTEDRGHAVTRDARFGGEGACAACHEFTFPDAGLRRSPELMQSTVSEHRVSAAYGAETCASCHMPLVEGASGGAPHRSHAFAASRDPAVLRSAVAVSASRAERTRARIEIAPARVGHAFPTGDLFRRLEVAADALGPDFEAVASSRRYLTRHFTEQKHPTGVMLRTVAVDDRPLSAPVTVEIDLGPTAASRPIAWRVAYQRVEHPRSDRPEDSLIDEEIVIAEGVLPAEDAQSRITNAHAAP